MQFANLVEQNTISKLIRIARFNNITLILIECFGLRLAFSQNSKHSFAKLKNCKAKQNTLNELAARLLIKIAPT